MIIRAIAMVVTLVYCSTACAGDEYHTPQLEPGTGYASVHPLYRLVGVERANSELRVWAVVPPGNVSEQTVVNAIIRDIHSRLEDDLVDAPRWQVLFYSAVLDGERPSFMLSDLLGYYDSVSNKTTPLTPGPGQGGWSHGPLP